MTFIFPLERRPQVSVIVCGVIFGILPVIAVCLRVLARRIANRKLDQSDWIIIAAAFLVVFYQGIAMSSVLVGGLGYHVEEIVERFGIESGQESFVKHLLAIQVFWTITLSLSKVSILLLCSRVFVVRGFILVAKMTAVFICLWAIATILSCFLICKPLAMNWDPTIEGGRCGDSVVSWVITGVLNILTDVVVLLLPMPYLYSLDLELYKKLVLMATFGVGLFTCIISGVRVATLTTVDFTDVTWTMPHAVLFSALEPCLAITLACVPVLRPLLGGRYSATGTAKFGRTTKAQTQNRPGPHSERLNDDDSIKQLNAEVFRTSQDGAASREAIGEVEMTTMTVRKGSSGWAVQRTDVSD